MSGKHAENAVALVDFLSGLPADAAAEARVAAAQIDTLEREIGPPNWIERNLLVLGGLSVALFILGAGGLIGVFAWGLAGLGLGTMTLMVSAFPALILAYLLSVRGRTRADDRKRELNERHFLPHGGLYYGSPGGNARVFLHRKKPVERNLRQQVEDRYDAATKSGWRG